MVDVIAEESDKFGPLKDFNAKYGKTNSEDKNPKKARRRRSMCTIQSIPEAKGNFLINEILKCLFLV